MKVKWEEQDIRSGRRFGRCGVKERCIIGWSPENGLRFIISLSDGMVTSVAGGAAGFADYLTAQGYLPEELLTDERHTINPVLGAPTGPGPGSRPCR